MHLGSTRNPNPRPSMKTNRPRRMSPCLLFLPPRTAFTRSGQSRNNDVGKSGFLLGHIRPLGCPCSWARRTCTACTGEIGNPLAWRAPQPNPAPQTDPPREYPSPPVPAPSAVTDAPANPIAAASIPIAPSAFQAARTPANRRTLTFPEMRQIAQTPKNTSLPCPISARGRPKKPANRN